MPRSHKIRIFTQQTRVSTRVVFPRYPPGVSLGRRFPAQAFGLRPELERWVLRLALRKAEEWPDKAPAGRHGLAVTVVVVVVCCVAGFFW